jgi:hypothetical protein
MGHWCFGGPRSTGERMDKSNIWRHSDEYFPKLTIDIKDRNSVISLKFKKENTIYIYIYISLSNCY